jgi:predicted MFS family arabinose efflux permease
MPMEEQRISWPAIIVVYLATVLCMAAVGVIAALTLDLAAAFDASKGEIGFAIAMYSLPSALAAIFCGGVIDRLGPKRVILAGCGLTVVGGLAIVALPSLPGLILGLVLSGIGYTGINVAAPAMFMRTASGGRRVRAMSLWSTYAPTGFAVGLVLAAPFAGHGHWTTPVLIHVVMMAAAGAAAIALLPDPRGGESMTLKAQLRGLASVVVERKVLRLAFTAAIPCALSYGTSLVAPAYLAETHGVAMGASATGVAAVKGVAMALCGVAAGAVLAHKPNIPRLFAGLAALGLAAQVLSFHPAVSFPVAIIGLGAWLVAYGGIAATSMSLLPTVVDDPARTGAAAGLVTQMMSFFSFLAPTVYFALQGWTAYILVGGVGLALATLLLPAWERRTAAAAPAV